MTTTTTAPTTPAPAASAALATFSLPAATGLASDTILTLPPRASSIVIAQRSREVALAFSNESQRWGKAELAMWLMGPYAQLMQYASGGTNRGACRVPLLREIDARMIERIVRNARAEVVGALQHMQVAVGTEASASFVFRMLAEGYVVRCEGTARGPGYVPSATASRLADRVLSLFAVDYLMRPMEYETSLSICPRCSTIDFDAVSALRGACHRHGSGLFEPRGRCSTMPHMPEGA